MAAILGRLTGRGAAPGRPPRSSGGGRYWLAATALMSCAAFMYLHQLASFPPGLDPDAALDGLEAFKITRHGILPFYILNNSNADPLFIYLQAGLQGLLGARVLTARLGSAFGGLLGLAALFPCLAESGRGEFDTATRRRIAGLAVAALASSQALAFIHRIGERFSIQIVFQMAAIWLLMRAVRSDRRRLWLAAGAAAGLTQYTYSAARMIPALLILVLLLWLPARWWKDRGLWRNLGVYVASAATTLLPQIVFYLGQPSLVLARARQTSLDQNPLYQAAGLGGVILDKLAKYGEALGAHWPGQYNQIKEPLFPALFFWAAILGLAFCLAHPRRRMSLFLLGGLALMLLPEMAAGDRAYPHELRAIGAYPFVAGLAGLGLGNAWGLARRRPRLDRALGLLVSAAVALTFAAQAQTFFVKHAARQRRSNNVWLRRVDVGVAGAINQGGDSYLLPLASYSHTVVKYLTAGRAVHLRSAVTASGDLLPAVRQAGPVIVIEPLDERGRPWPGDLTQWVLFAGDAAYVLPPLADEHAVRAALQNGQDLYDAEGIVRVGRAAALEMAALPLARSYRPQFPSGYCFAAGPCLAGLDLDETTLRAGGNLRVTLHWAPAGQAKDDYLVFVHLLDPAGNAIAGEDDYPLEHGYRTYEWRPGETVISTQRLALPETLEPGAYALEVGLYALPGVERLPVLDGAGRAVDDRIYLELLRAPRPPAALPATGVEAAGIVFEDEIELAGYRLDAAAGPGAPIELTLWWRGLRPASQKWVAFLHLAPPGESNALAAQLDWPPTGGAYPPTIWQAGEIVEEQVRLDVPAGAAAGRYAVWLGLYSPVTFERAAISAAPGRIEANRALLFEIEIK